MAHQVVYSTDQSSSDALDGLTFAQAVPLVDNATIFLNSYETESELQAFIVGFDIGSDFNYVAEQPFDQVPNGTYAVGTRQTVQFIVQQGANFKSRVVTHIDSLLTARNLTRGKLVEIITVGNGYIVMIEVIDELNEITVMKIYFYDVPVI